MKNNVLKDETKSNKIKDFFHKIFYKNVIVSVDEFNKPTKIIEKKRSKGLLYVLIVLLVFFGSFYFVNLPNRVAIDQLGIIFQKMFKPDNYSLKTWPRYWDYLFNSAVPAIGQTIEMVFIGTLIGTILAIPLFMLASKNISKHAYIYMPVRVIMDVIRSIPTYVLALMSVAFFGIGSTAGIVAIIIFTMGIMFKLMFEYLDTLDMNAFEACLSCGATRFEASKISLFPDANPMLISNFIYTFEINVRASVVLAWANAGGIGSLLKTAMEAMQYDKVGAILIPLFIVVFILQLISSFLRRKVL